MDPKFSRDEIDFGFFTLTLEIRTIFRNLTKNCSSSDDCGLLPSKKPVDLDEKVLTYFFQNLI